MGRILKLYIIFWYSFSLYFFFLGVLGVRYGRLDYFSDFTGVKMSQKHEILFLFHQDYFVKFSLKYKFFALICSLRLKLIYIHKNKVYSMFFIREIKKLVFCGTVVFCGTYTCKGNSRFCVEKVRFSGRFIT